MIGSLPPLTKRVPDFNSPGRSRSPARSLCWMLVDAVKNDHMLGDLRCLRCESLQFRVRGHLVKIPTRLHPHHPRVCIPCPSSFSGVRGAVGEMAQWVNNHLLCKHEHMGSGPQHSRKKPVTTAGGERRQEAHGSLLTIIPTPGSVRGQRQKNKVESDRAG